MITTSKTRKKAARQRLIDLAVWVAGEDAKRRLGLPSEWDQEHWLARGVAGCGTTCCMAGKITLDDGGIPVARDPSGEPILHPVASQAAWDSNGYAEASRAIMPNGRVVWIDDYAAKVLGLNAIQRHALFRGGNDLNGVLTAIQELLDQNPA